MFAIRGCFYLVPPPLLPSYSVRSIIPITPKWENAPMWSPTPNSLQVIKDIFMICKVLSRYLFCVNILQYTLTEPAIISEVLPLKICSVQFSLFSNKCIFQTSYVRVILLLKLQKIIIFCNFTLHNLCAKHKVSYIYIYIFSLHPYNITMRKVLLYPSFLYERSEVQRVR